jgi:hypothetical protein
MKIKILAAAVLILIAMIVVIPQVIRQIQVTLTGYEEVPAVSTAGNGELRARIVNEPSPFIIPTGETRVEYDLTYNNLQGNVTQAHIHFGQKGVNGGISVWLCANAALLPPGTVIPSGTPPCPAPPAQVSGVIRAANVIGPTAQGIAPGEFNELLQAMRAEMTYVNVHSTLFPGGEVRSQINTLSEQTVEQPNGQSTLHNH